jgi:hypothetical protein
MSFIILGVTKDNHPLHTFPYLSSTLYPNKMSAQVAAAKMVSSSRPRIGIFELTSVASVGDAIVEDI